MFSSFVAFRSQKEQNGAQNITNTEAPMKAVLNIQIRTHRHTADIPGWQVSVGLDVIWDNKDQHAIKDYNPQQIVIIQSSPGGRRRLFISWPHWCSGILFSLEISGLSSFGNCPTQLHSHVDTKERICAFLSV